MSGNLLHSPRIYKNVFNPVNPELKQFQARQIQNIEFK